MASISNDGNGRRILFKGPDGKRRTIRLGNVSKRIAEEVRIKVECILTARAAGMPLDAETASWLGRIGDDLHAKLANVGLAPPRQRAALGAFLAEFIERNRGDKQRTFLNFRQAAKRLTDHFGPDADMRTITHDDAVEFAAELAENYAPSTMGRAVKYARQFFKGALRSKLVDENPFTGIRAPTTPDETRKVYVPVETVERVIEQCPTPEWRLLIAMSRFAGLRCPSEHLTLRWADIQWDASRFTVRSPKTGTRVVPIFPRLLPFLQDARQHAPGDAIRVVERYSGPTCNLRTQLERYIRRAGVEQWPKLWHNMRASCETDLAAEFPLHVVSRWIGNSERVAEKHYLVLTETDMQRGAKSGAFGVEVSQKAAQHGPAPSTHVTTQVVVDSDDVPVGAGVCGENHYARRESNDPQETREILHIPDGAAQKAAHVFAAWSALSADERAAFMELVRRAA